MENNSDTRSQKNQNYLKIDPESINKSGSTLKLIPSYPSNDHLAFNSVQSTDQEDDWLYRVEQNNTQINIYDFQNELVCSLPNNEENRSNLNDFLTSYTKLKQSTVSESIKLNSDIKKTVGSLQKRYEKLEYYLQGKDQDHVFQSIRRLISKISHDLVSFIDLPEIILNSPLFKEIRTCQFLIHEKGTTQVIGFLSSRDKGKYTEIKKVKDFNKLFTHIKKSKNKVFDVSSIPKTSNSTIDTLGTFMGSSIELKSHNVILILSRESFLPPLEKEVYGFNFLTKSIQPFLDAFMAKEKKENTLFYKFIILKNLGFGIEIKDEEDTIIYSNDYRKAHPYQDEFDLLELTKAHRLFVYHDKNQDLITDFSHHERINLLGNLLNTLSHELSNPLFGMKLTSDLLLMEELNEDEKDTLQDVSNNLTRSQKILENFSQLYSDQITEVNLIELIQESLKLAKSEMRHIKRKFHFDPKIYPIIKSNPTWISQILFNLIINSSQAMSHQPPLEGFKLDINLIENNDQFQIIVSDNGPGIPLDIKQKIFEPFFTTKETGTGLGLIICSNLAKRMGGSLQLSEDYENGAQFILTLRKQ